MSIILLKIAITVQKITRLLEITESMIGKGVALGMAYIAQMMKENIQDSSSPKVVNINSERINFESGYLLDKEEDFFSYLNRIVNA